MDLISHTTFIIFFISAMIKYMGVLDFNKMNLGDNLLWNNEPENTKLQAYIE